MEQITLDPTKLKIVLIDEVRPNTWNPKDKDTREYKKVVESVRLKGQRQAIAVRENNGYEIIDGEQRWRACKELGFEKVIVYNEGVMADKEAQELTLWYQVQVPFNEVSLAGMITKMIADFPDMKVPFNQEEIKDMGKLAEFNWDDYKQTEIPEEEEDGIRTLNIIMNVEQYKIVQQAIDKIKEDAGDPDLSDARCLELICGDYLGGK